MLEKSGEAETLKTSQEFLNFQDVQDHNIQNAIEELQKSTSAIEKQTETLRAQEEAVATLLRTNKQSRELRTVADNAQYRAWKTEDGQIRSAVSGESERSVRQN